MSTSPVSGAAKTAARLYPVVTILALVLSFVLFISGDGGSLARTVVFMVWLALLVYSLIRVLSDVLSGQHKKEQSFQNTLDAFVQNTGLLHRHGGGLLPAEAGRPRGAVGHFPLNFPEKL